jgi:FkbM family methyltransferase
MASPAHYFWRNVIAPRLANSLAPRVAALLKTNDADRLAGGASAPSIEPPALAPAGAPQDSIGSLQVYKGYAESDIEILESFSQGGLHPEEGFIVDFLGGRTRTSSLYETAGPLAGHVFGIPVPGDFHAEAVEWIGVMKTALTAEGRYIAMEWGAGWAPWLIAGALAARKLGISDIKLYGVEADPHHYQAMTQHFVDNGFPPADHVLLQAAVGSAAGSAEWPDEPDSRNQWGARPLREGSQQDTDYLLERVDRFLQVKVLEARSLVLREPMWDMVHLDIQGWEGEVCRSCIDLLTERARWVVIGVHSRIQDAELLLIFHEAGWVLEHEKPTRFSYQRAQSGFESMVVADGTQVWRNPKLAAHSGHQG